MKKSVSLSDVLSDYISRYGLTEKARIFFLERVEQEDKPKGQNLTKEQDKPSSK